MSNNKSSGLTSKATQCCIMRSMLGIERNVYLIYTLRLASFFRRIAVAIYCAFKRRKSLGDAYLQGVLDTLATLPAQVTNALARMGIEDCDALLSVGCDELKKIHCIGAASIYQITCKMYELGFTEWAEEVRKKLFD